MAQVNVPQVAETQLDSLAYTHKSYPVTFFGESVNSLSRMPPRLDSSAKWREGNTLPYSSRAEPTHIERGYYIADVLHHTSAEPFWYYVIQRKESNGIIDLVKFKTYEQAIARAREVLAQLNQAPTSW